MNVVRHNHIIIHNNIGIMFGYILYHAINYLTNIRQLYQRRGDLTPPYDLG